MKDVISAINRGDPDEISAALVELAASLDGLGGAMAADKCPCLHR